MSHYKKFNFKEFIKNLATSYLPNRKDNAKQITVKIIFLAALVGLIISVCYLVNYFSEANTQEKLENNAREIWYQESLSPDQPTPFERMLAINDDFMGWLTIENTNVDHPVYQADDNDYYLNHNQEKKVSGYGALYYDYRTVITKNYEDQNLVIYGHSMKNGSMFGKLKLFRDADYYDTDHTITLTTVNGEKKYVVFSTFLLNAVREDDNNYIFNIYKTAFATEEEFNEWIAEAKDRSLVDTGIDVNFSDSILTFVTCCDDFDDARLIIMARELHEDEVGTLDTSIATENPDPRYPKIWYDDRKLEYPYGDQNDSEEEK